MISKLKLLGLAILTVFAPEKAVVLTTFTLVLADLITGLISAYKTKIPITSAGLRRSVIKLFIYETAVLLGFLAQAFLTGDLVPVCKIITSYIGLTEMISIMENLNIISGGSLMQSLINKLGSLNGQ